MSATHDICDEIDDPIFLGLRGYIESCKNQGILYQCYATEGLAKHFREAETFCASSNSDFECVHF